MVPILHFLRRGLLPTLLLLVACAPTAPPPAPLAAPARQPDRGGVILYPSLSAPATLHPYKGGGTDERRALGPAYETLVSFDWQPDRDYRIDFKVVPWLAESWEQVDNTTYLFHLRKGVLWHDGTPFTANDVVFSYSYAADPKNAFPRRSLLRNVERTERLDDFTVRVVTKEPSPYLLEDLADSSLFIVPKHVVDRGESLDRVLVGTGPYRLKSSDLKKENLFERFDGYWQSLKPYPDGMRIVFGLDRSTMFAAFVTGEADMIPAQTKAQAEPILRSVPGAQLKSTTADVGIALRMQVDRPPFNDIRVRRALHLAVDRQAMWRTLTDGKGDINPPGVPGSKAGWAIPSEELFKLPGYRQPKDQDLVEAKRLLAEAGQSKLKFSVLHTTEGSVAPLVIEALVAQWRQIGVDAVSDGRDNATYRKLDSEGNFDTSLTYTAKMNVVQYVPDLFRTGAALNTTGVSDPELDRTIDTILTSFDEGARKAAARKMQEVLLEKLYFVPTIDIVIYHVLQPWVRDYTVSSSNPFMDIGNASQVWLDRELLPAKRKQS